MGVQPIDTDFKGPLPKDTVGLLLGHSSSALKGLQITPGVIDPGYAGVVKILVAFPSGISAVSPGDRIAQLLLLPSLHKYFPANNKIRGESGLGSTGSQFTFLSMELGDRPMLTLEVEGQSFLGLLDTGADCSSISTHDWPSKWPLQTSSQSLRGLGYETAPLISAKELTWKNEEGKSGKFFPYIVDIPVTLWGRDVLTKMDLRLTNEYSPQAREIMSSMGYTPGKGLGKSLQGMIKMGNLGEFLGARITPHFITPQKIELCKDHLKTLNNFQKLLGDTNWIRPYMRLSNFELIPLFDILKGDPQLSSPRALTPEARVALEKVERCLEKAKLYRWKEGEDILLCVLKTFCQPTGVLWQSGPLLWIYPHVSPNKTLEYYPIAVAQLAILGIKSCIQHFGAPPQKIITPYNANQIQILSSLIDDWALLRCSFDGELDNHYPKDPLLQFFSEHPVIFPKVTASKPISGALDIYTDGSKTGVGAYVVNSQKPVLFQYNPGTPQLTECKIVLEVFKAFKESFNLVSDSAYVVNAVRALEIAGPIRPTSPVCTILLELQKLIWKRTHKFFIQHIRAHSTLPGPMAERNALVDASTRMEFIFHATPLELAKDFHQLYHVPAATLQQKFDISRASARDVVLQCPQCVQFHHPPHVGINPRGLLPLKLWQMDVTHVSAFGRLKYVHVSIDTCSGVIFASPMSGEKSRNVVGHCLEAWAAWGRPDSLKTDNGPAYTSKSFQTFCKIMQVSHSTGLPYNPQGQGIVERAHRTLKELLQKQKGGIADGRPPKEQLSLALFTLNF